MCGAHQPRRSHGGRIFPFKRGAIELMSYSAVAEHLMLGEVELL